MIRSVFLFLLVALCALGAQDACAQDSPSDLLMRIDRLEAAIRNLTGNVEQLQYRNQQLEQQVQRLQAQLQGGAQATAAPPRPTGPYSPPGAAMPVPVVAGAPPSASAPIEPAAPPSRRGDAFDPTLNPNAPGAPRPLGASTAATEPPPPVSDAVGPRQLGAPLDLSTPPKAAAPGSELPPPPPNNPSGTGALQATLPPTNSPRDQFDLGYGYLLHKDYALAASTFRAFLRQYPSDRLTPEAQYWLGESLYQQQQFHDAAEAFLAVSTKYDTTARAPDALLRLGQSLAALGEKEAACASLGEVLRKYPHVAANIKQAVEREQKRGHC